ncbi:MAG: response regulator transcription factor [Microscillaceae bacterium]|nr:response regulator transcription factor [Microscillaceae bacterium]
MNTLTKNTTPENTEIKILIVEDEKPIGELIKNTLEKFQYQVTKVAANYDEALESIQLNPPHLAICDINIGYPDGVATAEAINKKLPKPIPIIFLTAHYDDETKTNAFATRPSSYLIKSQELVSQEYQLDAAIQLALSNLQNQEEEAESVKSRVIGENYDIWVKGMVKRIKIAEILYLEADNVSTRIITQNKLIINAAKSLGKTLEELIHPDIIQCHRSYAVNIKKIEEYDSGVTFVILDKSELKIKEESKKVIPVGKKYKEEVKKALGIV